MIELDTARAQRGRIREAVTGSGMSMREASERLGRDKSWLQKFVSNGRKPVNPRLANAIAGITGKPVTFLLTGQEAPVGETAALLSTGSEFKVPRDLSLFRGVTVGGAAEGLAHVVPELTERPVPLIGVPEGFAVRIGDDRLKPRYRRGDVLYCHPGAAFEAEDCVAIQLRDSRLLVGILVAADDRGITLRSLNPVQTLTYSEVIAIAREIGVARR